MRRARRMDGRPGLNMAAGSLMRRVLRKFFIVTIWRKRYVPNRRVGSYQEVGTYRSTFAVISLWGKFGGLHACGDTFPHIVPLPNILLTRLFSKLRLKRKDFQEILRLPWAQEVGIRSARTAFWNGPSSVETTQQTMPSCFSPTSVQFKGEINGALPRK